MYVCGPTVYDKIHIGNARPIVIFDCFRKYLEHLGFVVKYVQNFTDIDDKIIKKANELKISPFELAEKYIKEYEKDAKLLGVFPPTVAPKVTKNIDLIIELIKSLVEKNYAYVSNGNVFFNALSFKDYGKLSNMPLKELEKGEMVLNSNFKKNPLDFVLWKSFKKGEPFWSSPWGNGRPGWHIECSALALNFLGETIDIHCGGQDLIFPHHENEIAQSEAKTNKKFSNYWMHNGHVKINGRKMSKSLGNFLTVREIGEKHGYDVLRFFIVSSHYKMPINFTKSSLSQSSASLKRMQTFKNNLNFFLNNLKEQEQKNANLNKTLKEFEEEFFSALNEDFNTALAVSVIFKLIKWGNVFLKSQQNLNKADIFLIKNLFLKLTKILGILKETDCNISKEVIFLKEQRDKARKEKNFVLADELRKKIEDLGYYVEETRFGSRIFKKQK